MDFVDPMRLLAASLVLVQHMLEGRRAFVKSWLIPLAPGVASVAIFSFISGYVIPLATRQGRHVREFMVRRLFRIYPLFLVTLAVIGGVSYSIYLLHPIAMADARFAPVLQVPLAVVLMFALAWAGSILVEKPGMKLGRRVARRWTSPIGVERVI
jgi:peptidoglycan/LPS O-acetylase OafA/YrhL